MLKDAQHEYLIQRSQDPTRHHTIVTTFPFYGTIKVCRANTVNSKLLCGKMDQVAVNCKFPRCQLVLRIRKIGVAGFVNLNKSLSFAELLHIIHGQISGLS